MDFAFKAKKQCWGTFACIHFYLFAIIDKIVIFSLKVPVQQKWERGGGGGGGGWGATKLDSYTTGSGGGGGGGGEII